jgi:hypothetical protein
MADSELIPGVMMIAREIETKNRYEKNSFVVIAITRHG